MLLSFCLSVSRITLVADLDAFFHSSRRPLPLLVRILHRSRIRYYGKPGQNIDFPFQVSWGYKSHCFLSAAIDFFSGYNLSSSSFFCSLSVSGVLWGGWSEWRHVYGCMEWSLSWVVQPTDCWLGSISAAVLVETQLSEALETADPHTLSYDFPLHWYELQSFSKASFLMLQFQLGLCYTGFSSFVVIVLCVVEICLNPRSPASVVTVIPPKSVQPQWGLPDVPYNFATRYTYSPLTNTLINFNVWFQCIGLKKY